MALQTTVTSIRLRWLETNRDLPHILPIEEDNFEFPWTAQNFISCLYHRNISGLVAERVQVAPCRYCSGHKPPSLLQRIFHKRQLECPECDGNGFIATEDIVGFILYELSKAHYRILNFAVEKTLKRQGIGTRMVRRLIENLCTHRRQEIILDIRESNIPAQLFFKNLGFRAVKVLRNFYEDTTEDAYSMHYVLPPQDDIYSPWHPTNRLTQYDIA